MKNKKKIKTRRLVLKNVRYSKKALAKIMSQTERENKTVFSSKSFRQQKKRLRKETERSLLGSFATYGIFKDKKYCGYVEINARGNGVFELGINLKEKYRRRGIGTESCTALCNEVCSRHGIDSVIMRIMHDNTASICLAAKLGAVLKERTTLLESFAIPDLHIDDYFSEEQKALFAMNIYTVPLPVLGRTGQCPLI